jgi:serine/threonine protein kinase
MPLAPGTRVGSFEVAGILGAGGMGEVYRARDTRLKRDVALKMTRAGFNRPDTMSPTITSPALMTGVGVLLGTAAYMSPEQAKVRPAGKRSDLWAFGCVFYEMLTGRRAFEGDDVTETLAAVMKTMHRSYDRRA